MAIYSIRPDRQGCAGDRRQQRHRPGNGCGDGPGRRGYRDLGHQRREKRCSRCEDLAPTGRRVSDTAMRCGDEAEVQAAFARTLDTFGRVDGCFANAGVSGRGGHTFLEMTSAEWHRVTRVNLDGAFYTFRTAAKHMVERGGGGVLVGTASLAAIEAAPRSEHYAATKGGMISMVKAMAVEFARYGVRAHSILPGWIETNMTANAVNTEGFKTKVLPRVPMRRWGKGADFGGIAVYLMSSASNTTLAIRW